MEKKIDWSKADEFLWITNVKFNGSDLSNAINVRNGMHVFLAILPMLFGNDASAEMKLVSGRQIFEDALRQLIKTSQI